MNMEKSYRFDITVISAVYNVEDYIEEALDSLINQDYDQWRVQYILVDDGSQDRSGEICDRFKDNNPDNVIVIHKVNGGQASARLAAIPYVEGKYVSFFDPDDTLSNNVFKEVFAFFEEHCHETDVVAIPIFFFGDINGPHPLNNKFCHGSRVINLREAENYQYTQMSMASAFFSREAIKLIGMDEALVTAEDAKELIKILTEKFTLGVVDGVKYNYRKRRSSTVGGAPYKAGWYSTYLERYTEWAIQYCLDKVGFIPHFVQYALMHDLQWKIKQQHIPTGVLIQEDKEKYQKKLFSLVKYFDDKIILEQKSLAIEHKMYLLYNKYKTQPSLITQENVADIHYSYNDNIFYSASKFITYINRIDVADDKLTIEGAILRPYVGVEEVQVYVEYNGRKHITEEVRYTDTVYAADLPIAERKGFIVTIPLSLNNKQSIRVWSLINGVWVKQERIVFGKYAPLTHQYYRSYYLKNGWLIRPIKEGITIEKGTGWDRIRCESRFLFDLLRSKNAAAHKAVVARLMYFIVKPFCPDNIWLISDKSDRADDNGEAFFRFLMDKKDRKCTPVFAVSKTSSDYNRMRKLGRVVPYMSWRYKLLHLLAAHTISAYSHNEISSPFLDYSRYYGDLLQNNKVVFLQHGIIKDDLSPSLNRRHKNFELFVTSTEREREAVLSDNYGYNEEQVILTGLPRYDRLYNNPQKKITIMPTWLRSLFGDYDPKTSKWTLLPGFEDSQYYNFYNGLLNSQELLDYAQSRGYTIQFLAHPVLFPYLDRFKPDARVVVLDSNVCYRDVFAESSLITTDYSSVAFDFAYLKKPVVYTQFEENHYIEGYFDYEKDGFGEVEHTLERVIKRLIEYMQNDCLMKKEYKDRIEGFFMFHDQNNCQRVYDRIVKLDTCILKE